MPNTMKTDRRLLAALLLAAALVAAAFGIERLGGHGPIPTWEQLHRWLGVSPEAEAPASLPDASGLTSVTVFDVGQADAVLLAQSGAYCLIDTGTAASAEDLLLELQHREVEKLELLVLTHAHADHFGGAIAVLDSIPTERVLVPSLEETDTGQGWRNVLEYLRQEGIPTVAAEAGQEYCLGSGVLTVLMADFVPPEDSGDDPVNDTSLCGRFAVEGFSYLFTGDAEQQAEAALLEQYGGTLRATVLKAGHHGSSTSSSEAFLRAVQPQSVVFSCGLNNEYGHPHREVVERCQALGAVLWRTDRQGSVTFTYDGEVLDAFCTGGALDDAA
ncbi:MAG: ComEC/Rec2 family competence protein [Gemmiger sp.]